MKSIISNIFIDLNKALDSSWPLPNLSLGSLPHKNSLALSDTEILILISGRSDEG